MILNESPSVYYTIQQAKVNNIQNVFFFDGNDKLFRKMIFEKGVISMRQDSYGRLLAQRLSSLTKESGMPLRDLADEMDVSAGALSNYQNGKAEPGLTALCAIADYFDVPLDWLVGRSQVKNDKAPEAAICEYLRLNQDNVKYLEHLTSGGHLEEHRVHEAEAINWLLGQKEFRRMINAITIAIWMASEKSDSGETHSDDFFQYLLQNMSDPKYVAITSLTHLLDDRIEDYLTRRELNGKHSTKVQQRGQAD